MKLPDGGAPAGAGRDRKFRRAAYAGLMTSPSGVLGNPSLAKPNLA